ncbi:MAG: SusD/RagB family nutrient-binding outer membrane lipoprotein [Tannerella sp.]|jgi:hypothetical protein|nr:SusD/RagB family nutrient-binding outer membrane lipoprotein [Tannerella sp.]
MERYKFTQTVAAFALIAFATAGCSEDRMDAINKRNDNPLDVPAKFLITDVLTSTAFNTVGGDFSFYASVYMEHETGIYHQMYHAETRNGEPAAPATYDHMWSATYVNIKNAKIVIAKCLEEGGADYGNDVTLGVAEVMLAYNAAVLTDLFGDVPFTEAGEINPDGTPKYMQPRIDRQEDIYRAVFDLLDEAIIHFNGSDAGVTGALGDRDLIYEGNKRFWRQAAYGLKARYTMRLLGRSAYPAVDLENIISYVDHSFTNAAEELKFNHYDGDSNVNPLFGFNYSREALGASQSLFNKFVACKDPRINRYFSDGMKIITDPDEVIPAPNGNPIPSLQGEIYDRSSVTFSLVAPTQLLSYHELLFLKAEALSRLNHSDAEAALKEAVMAAFANLDVSIGASVNSYFEFFEDYELGAEAAGNYFDTEVAARFHTAPLQEIMLQKYLAFAGASGESIEAYNDYRRLKYLRENFISLANSHNATLFPHRFSYGASDVVANNAVKNACGDGSYVYTEPVWWAGGYR